jgi:hypothetical protein
MANRERPNPPTSRHCRQRVASLLKEIDEKGKGFDGIKKYDKVALILEGG